MRVVISEHAEKRAEERGVSVEVIEDIVKRSEEVVTVKFGRKAAYRKYGDRYVVVIFEERKDEIVVVTTLKVDKERLKRYGFSRV